MNTNLKNLEIALTSAEFASRVEYSAEQVGLLLSSFQDEFAGDMDLVGKDNKDENFVFRNKESKNSKQVTIIIAKKSIQLAWGNDYDEGKAKSILSKIADVTIKNVNHFQNVLQYLDTEYIFDFKTKKNHYKVINDVVYANSPLANLTKIGKRNLTNDVKYSIELNDSCILIVSLIGGHSEQDIKNNTLEERTLRIRFSVGKTKELTKDSLSKIALNHLEYVKELVEGQLLPLIVQPIANELA